MEGSPAGEEEDQWEDEQWTPEEEEAAMREVLGYEPASSEDMDAAATEMRLMREQTALLIQEIRLLRQALQTRTAAGTLEAAPAPPVAAAPAAAPAATPAPAPQAAQPPAPAPAPARRTGFPAVDFPPVPASAVPEKPPPPTPPPPPLRSRGEAFAPTAAPPAPAPAGATARLVSAGFETGNAADFEVDGSRIELAGEWGRRGVNVVAIDPGTGEVLSRTVYDIWGNPNIENAHLAADLNALSDGVVVLLALKDSGMENLEPATIAALQQVGSTITGPLGVREGYALIGSKGGPALAERRGPQVEVEAVLPCDVVPPSGPPPQPASAPAAPAAPFAAPAGFAGAPPRPASPFAAPAGLAGATPAQPFAAPAAPARAAPAPAPASPLPPFPVAPEQPAQPPPPPFPVASPEAPAQAPLPRAPKLRVDEQGGVRFSDAEAEMEAGDGKSWQEVVLMLDRLQEKIKAKRLAGQTPAS